jgi:hypothetical protein
MFVSVYVVGLGGVYAVTSRAPNTSPLAISLLVKQGQQHRHEAEAVRSSNMSGFDR